MFTTDVALVVQTWDAWMVDATGLAESVACGERLVDLYPELADRGLIARLKRVAGGSGVDVLAPAFHKYLIPCPPRDRTSQFERMRQHVTIAPVRGHDGIAGVVVTIEDVTPRLDRERRLTADLDSQDEAIRLRAAEALAAGGDSPTLLADALTDSSWRVRRVAADGMAAGGGREVIDKLIEALRENHRDPSALNAALTALAKTRDDVVGAVTELLEVDDAELRTYAALALGLIGDTRAVPALIRLLQDADVNVRFHAIEALGRIGDPDAAEEIAAIAETRDFFLAFAALDALAAIGESSVVPRLMPLLEDESLLPATIACLGALGSDEVAIPLAKLFEQPSAPVGTIALALADVHDRMQAEFGEGGLVADFTRSVMTAHSARILIEALSTPEIRELGGIVSVLSWLPFDGIDEALAGMLRRADTRQAAAAALAHRGVRAAAPIECVAKDEISEIRKVAAHVLGRIGSATSLPALVGWLDGESDVIISAAAALGAIGDRDAFAPLLAVLDHPESSVRQAAVAALNSIGHPQMEEAIARSLKDPSPRVRESAARIAGYFGYGSCLRQMVELCDDDDEMVRRSAVEHLANFDQRPAWSKIAETLQSDPSPTVRAAAARAMGQSSTQEGIRALVAAADDRNLWVRYYALRSIGRRGEPHADALACLAEHATRDDAPPVRIAAIDALASVASPIMIDVILPLAQDREPDVACAALLALAAFDPARTAGVLMRALADGDLARRAAALDTLGRQRASHAVHAIADIARTDRDDEMRRKAIRALSAIGDAAAVRALVSLSADRRMRETVAAALASIEARQVPALRDALNSPNETARRTVIEALSRMRFDSVASVIALALDDESPSVRAIAARALGRLDLRDARAQLAMLATTDESPAVRIAARDALSRG